MPAAHVPVHHHAHARRHARHIDRRIAHVINQARAYRGLQPLRFARPLQRVARWHSADLLSHGLLSHSGSNGAPFDARIHSVTRAASVGETIALFRGRTTATMVVRAWIASPPHRAQLLSARYGRVGVGLVRRGGVSVITADFAAGR